MAKPKTSEEAKALVETLKAEIATDSEALKAYMKEKKIKKGETPADEKVAKRYEKMVSSLEKKRADRDAAKEAIKALAPKAERKSTYEYPADVVTAADKKKYRTKMRSEAKRAANGDTPKKEKVAKVAKAEKSEAPAKEGKSKAERIAAKKAKKAKETATPVVD